MVENPLISRRFEHRVILDQNEQMIALWKALIKTNHICQTHRKVPYFKIQRTLYPGRVKNRAILLGPPGPLSIDVEKVDEQNLNTNAFGWSPFRTTERSPIMALSQNDDIAYNDRIKIAHVFTDGEFEFPDLMKVFKKDLEFEKADRVMTAITEHLDNMVLEDGKLSVKDFTHLKEKYGPLITQLNTKIADYNNKKIEKELQTTKQILEKWPKHEKITNLVRHELEMKNNTEGQMSLNYQRLRNLDDFPFFAVMHAEYAFNFLKLMMNGHSKNFNYKFFERYEPTDKLIPIPEIRNKDEYFFLRRIGPRLQKWLGDKEEVKKSKAQATDFNKLIRDPKKISKQILDISPKSQKEKDDEATKTDSDVLRQLDMPDKYKNFKGINLQLYTGTHKAIEDGLVELAKDPTKDIKDLVGNVRQAAVEEVKLFDKERLMRRRRLKHKEMETGKSLKEREEEDEIKREYLKKYQDWSKEKAIAESKLKVDEKYRREVRPFGRE